MPDSWLQKWSAWATIVGLLVLLIGGIITVIVNQHLMKDDIGNLQSGQSKVYDYLFFKGSGPNPAQPDTTGGGS